MNTVKKSRPILSEKKTSYFVFLWPLVIVIASLIYIIQSQHINFLYLLLGLLFVFLQPFLLFWGKKVVLTDKKIYIFSKNKKIISWSLTNDLKFVTYEQNTLGKFFGYGTLTIVKLDNSMYNYHYLSDVFQIYEKIVVSYEKEMMRIDPDYKSIYEKTSAIDTNIDHIEE